MLRRRIAVAALGVVGVGSLGYVVAVRAFVLPVAEPAGELSWPLLGVLPLFVMGMGLLTATRSRIALLLALAATSMAVGSALETYIHIDPDVLLTPGYVYLNTIALTADGLATASFMMVIATFPSGRLAHRWQRLAIASVWACALIAPLTLLTHPLLVLPQYLGMQVDVPNPVAVPALEWAAPAVEVLVVWPWVLALVTLGVFASRALGPDPHERRVLRPMGVTLLVLFGAWSVLVLASLAGNEDSPLVRLLSGVEVAGLLALPVVLIHGILVHGAFDVAAPQRPAVVLRTSSAMVTVLYGIAVAAPAILLIDRVEPAGAVLLTTIAALALLPLRGWLQRTIRHAVLGDDERHLGVLADLGRRLERAPDLDEVLATLADATQRGLDATWVRVSVDAAGRGAGAAREAVAGTPSGPAVAQRDLVRGDDVVGRIELGPRRRGEYPASGLALLDTVARQATSTVAAVRLTARLEEGLEELRTSRARLVSVQDAERRRIERDLHDGVQASIVALIANLALARQRLQRGQLAEHELAEVQDQAREVLVDLRELAHGIHPQVLTDRGLVAAVESRTARFAVPVRVLAGLDLRDTRLDADTEAVALYVVSEALANTGKHAGADAATVRLVLDGDVLRVEVSDEGCGFEPAGSDGSDGRDGSGVADGRPRTGGLANIRDRVAALGGRLVVDSRPGRGTSVRAELPAPRRHGTDEGSHDPGGRQAADHGHLVLDRPGPDHPDLDHDVSDPGSTLVTTAPDPEPAGA